MVSISEMSAWMEKLHNWGLEGSTIVKDFKFENFQSALDFINKVGEISEEQRHYPDIMLSNSTLRLSISSTDLGGLAERDFKLAQAIDEID